MLGNWKHGRANHSTTEMNKMANHDNHDHQHGSNCGHTAIQHDGHTDYLHDGHLHHVTAAGIEEHALTVGGTNPSACTPTHDCGGHAKGHVHGADCGHEAVPHGDHCDDHGVVKLG